jgi:nucleotide-binding universal stress UspA family protein
MNADRPRAFVAVDGTSRGDGALKYAAEEARAVGLSLRRSLGIVHVSPDYVPMTPLLPYLPADVEAEGRAISARRRNGSTPSPRSWTSCRS